MKRPWLRRAHDENHIPGHLILLVKRERDRREEKKEREIVTKSFRIKRTSRGSNDESARWSLAVVEEQISRGLAVEDANVNLF